LHEALREERRDGELTLGERDDGGRGVHVNRGDERAIRREDFDGIVAAIGDVETAARVEVDGNGVADRGAV